MARRCLEYPLLTAIESHIEKYANGRFVMLRLVLGKNMAGLELFFDVASRMVIGT